MNKEGKICYGFIKPSLDAHTMGIISAMELLQECNCDVVLADGKVNDAMNDFKYEAKRREVLDWIISNGISHLGISYRLDQEDAISMLGYLVEDFRKSRLLKSQGGQLFAIFYGGFAKTCEAVKKAFKGLVETFPGGETEHETLSKMGVESHRIPADIAKGSKYDASLLEFGKNIIDSQEYLGYRPQDRSGYLDFGTKKDTVVKRLDANLGSCFEPLIRAHAGPYSSALDRLESVNEFVRWVEELAKSGYLDILSIGSSQLSQSNFGEDWEDKTNGGGVPINSPQEYRMIWEASRPLLVRTYAGTKNIPYLAQIYEQTINICWHALSLWWFNKLDGRGPYDVHTNLKQHLETIRYIARTGKPFEANVSHHFAFRGADDVTYIVSAYLAAKTAKKLGIKTFLLQNMLNTPRSTWGIQDLAKSRALLKLIKGLEESNFRVLFQPRAGLDYFKPDLYEARIQLAAVTALMDDIEPFNDMSPPIIHVVSYSEASHLATPDVINESIQITQHSLKTYRKMRRQGEIQDMNRDVEVNIRSEELYFSARELILAIETSIEDPYCSRGLYLIFAAGFLPVPYIWHEAEEFKYAANWITKPIKGSIKVVDEHGSILKTNQVIEIAQNNLQELKRM